METKTPQWRPIESAPKDGTEVLLFSQALGQSFASNFDGGCWQNMPWVRNQKDLHISHWMPLPDAPEVVPAGGHNDRPKQDWDA